MSKTLNIADFFKKIPLLENKKKKELQYIQQYLGIMTN